MKRGVGPAHNELDPKRREKLSENLETLSRDSELQN